VWQRCGCVTDLYCQVCVALVSASSSCCVVRSYHVRSTLGRAACVVPSPYAPCRNTSPAPRGPAHATETDTVSGTECVPQRHTCTISVQQVYNKCAASVQQMYDKCKTAKDCLSQIEAILVTNLTETWNDTSINYVFLETDLKTTSVTQS